MHEGPIALIKKMPGVVPSLLAIAGLGVPEGASARIESADLGEMNPTGLRADLVATVKPSKGAPISVIVEVQRAEDPEKKPS